MNCKETKSGTTFKYTVLINDLMLYLKLLEKQEQANPKTSRKREIIKNKG
jgi:hypothetical protein